VGHASVDFAHQLKRLHQAQFRLEQPRSKDIPHFSRRRYEIVKIILVEAMGPPMLWILTAGCTRNPASSNRSGAMRVRKFRVLPVVDEEHRIKGIITIKDAFEAVFPEMKRKPEVASPAAIGGRSPTVEGKRMFFPEFP
jgi:hypothetical protein